MVSSTGAGRGSTSRSDDVVLLLRDTGLLGALDGVHEELESLLEAGPRLLTVDMSGVDVTSTTVAALLWVKRRCVARGVEVALRGHTRRSVSVLKRIGFVDDGRPTDVRTPSGHRNAMTWGQA